MPLRASVAPTFTRDFRLFHADCPQGDRCWRGQWENIRAFSAVHYKINTRLDTPFWRECRDKTDIAEAKPLVDQYAENGPSNFWSPTLLDAYEPFKFGGYATLLVGMQVPFRRAGSISQMDQENWQRWRARNRSIAEQAVSVDEALRAVHSTDWRWGTWASGHEVYGK